MINIKNIILLFPFLILGCGLLDPKEIFLQTIQGKWVTTDSTESWFRQQVLTTVNVGTPVIVASDGSFTIEGISFSFIEIEQNGIVVVYQVVNNATTPPTIRFTGIGFGEQDDVLINPTAVVLPTAVVSTAKGEIFLRKNGANN